jgi:hypothetical protein
MWGGRHEPPPADDAAAWIVGALPDDWFIQRPEVTIDRDEIVIVGRLPEPRLGDSTARDTVPSDTVPSDDTPSGDTPSGDETVPAGPATTGAATTGTAGAGSAAGSADAAKEKAAAERGRISSFREATRDHRIRIAQQLERRYRRKVAWGVVCGDTEELFTTLAAPAMTRLRQPERQVLDTLVDAGVARSRSEALAWCVRLVGEHADSWLGQLREAMGAVDELRRQGPSL